VEGTLSRLVGPRNATWFWTIPVFVALVPLFSISTPVLAQSSSASTCTAPPHGNCTLTFNLTDGDGLSGNFGSELPVVFCVYYVPSPDECIVGGPALGAYSGGSFHLNSTVTGYGNYVFKFDNSNNDVSNTVTLTYTHIVKESAGVGLGDVPEFPSSFLTAAALVAVVVISYLVARPRREKGTRGLL